MAHCAIYGTIYSPDLAPLNCSPFLFIYFSLEPFITTLQANMCLSKKTPRWWHQEFSEYRSLGLQTVTSQVKIWTADSPHYHRITCAMTSWMVTMCHHLRRELINKVVKRFLSMKTSFLPRKGGWTENALGKVQQLSKCKSHYISAPLANFQFQLQT